VSALLAFLHHLAAFAIAAALAVEFVLIRGTIDVQVAHRIRLVDAVYGASAGLLLIVGLLRVFHFEKGAAYYFANGFFIAKLALFIVVGLLSVYPTIEFLRWRSALARNDMPIMDDAKLRVMRRILHWELAGVVLIILCAALMARGIGQL
jgi:putative membrane protein